MYVKKEKICMDMYVWFFLLKILHNSFIKGECGSA